MVRVSKTRRAGRRTLNMLAVAALTGLSMTGLSQAQAQEGCAFHWGGLNKATGHTSREK